MGKKNLVVIGAVLIILIIAVGVAYQNSMSAKNAKSQLDLLNGSIQQKDAKIVSLTKELKETQDALTALKGELDTAKKGLDEAKAQMNSTVKAAEDMVKEVSPEASAVSAQVEAVQ